MKNTLTPEKCKAARALLKWSQIDLAKESHIGLTTVRTFESGNNISTRETSIILMVAAFEKAGISFLENGVILER